ncbi:hypothetical protein MED121_15909 [Marinomonas sp. MED121]|nr:hypothetical protein MED121_15909 [Marinomonas sp. MED121]
MKRPDRYFMVCSDIGNPVVLTLTREDQNVYLNMEISGFGGQLKMSCNALEQMCQAFSLEGRIHSKAKWRHNLIHWISISVTNDGNACRCRVIHYGLGFSMSWFDIETEKLEKFASMLAEIQEDLIKQELG